MNIQLEKEIEKLKRQILALSAKVENDVCLAVRAADNLDAAIARDVVNREDETNLREVDVEEECLKILALHQPVAVDLRYIVAVLKLNNDLERIGDLAVNIAERAEFINSRVRIDIPFDFAGLSEKTQAMLRNSLDALVHMDARLARHVCEMDDEVDTINRQMYDQVKNMIRAHPDQVDVLIAMLSVSRYLERVADHATNIAEDVLYMIEGRIVRHGRELGKLKTAGDS